MRQVNVEFLSHRDDSKFRHLLEKLPAAAYTCDPQGHITYFNERAVELWGREPKLNDAEDRFCGSFRLFTPSGTPIHHQECWMALALRNDHEYNGHEIVIERADGSRRFVAAYANPFHDGQNLLAGAVNVLVDITDRKQSEERLQEETRIAETLHRIGSLLAAELDLENLIQAVTDETIRLTEAEFGAFVYNAQDGPHAVVIHSNLAGAAEETRVRLAVDSATSASFAPTEWAQRPVRIEDVTQDACFQDNPPNFGLADAPPVKSYLAVPVTSRGGEVLGSLRFGHSRIGVFTERHESLAVGIAAQAAIAIDNARLYQQARDQAEQLQAASRRKDEFLAMLAHELRNPLVPIRSGLDILAMDPSNNQEAIGMMQEQVQHVVRLVDDLMDVSRIMRGKVELRREPVELAVLVKRSVGAVRPVIESRRQEIVVSVAEQALWVNVDPVRIVQILGNLLNNASKYMDDGGRIDLDLVAENGQAVIRVRDSGIGIEPELLSHVFELFTQASRSLDRAQGGLGIGLTLVQRLIEMHDGTVSVASDGPGCGSTFTVRLPLSAVPSQMKEATSRSPMNRRRRVVVVDDNVSGAWLLAMLLGKLGDHEVLTAHDGPTALQMIQETRPEIVFLDIGLPGMDGYQVGRAIRQILELDDVLLVALTGYGQEQDRQESKLAGFDEHLVKPPAVDQIQAILTHPKLTATE